MRVDVADLRTSRERAMDAIRDAKQASLQRTLRAFMGSAHDAIACNKAVVLFGSDVDGAAAWLLEGGRRVPPPALPFLDVSDDEARLDALVAAAAAERVPLATVYEAVEATGGDVALAAERRLGTGVAKRFFSAADAEAADVDIDALMQMLVGKTNV